MIRKSIFYYSASTQFSNAGDALINRELLSLLRLFGEMRIARAGAPDAFLEEIGARPGEVRHEKRSALMLEMIKRAIQGKASEQSYLVLTPGDPPGNISVGDLVRALLFPFLRLLGVRIVKIGASVSRMQSSRLRLEAFLSKFMYYYGLRDQGSIERARSFSFRNTEYCPDLAFNLVPVQAGESASALGISLRNDNLTEEEWHELRARCKSLVTSLATGTGDDPKVAFVAQVERDAAGMRDLQREWSFPGSDFIQSHSLRDLQDRYRELGIVISNRLHVILLAAASGSTPICLPTGTKNSKITQLLHSVGLAKLVVVSPSEMGDIAELRAAIQPAFEAQRRLLHSCLSSKLQS